MVDGGEEALGIAQHDFERFQRDIGVFFGYQLFQWTHDQGQGGAEFVGDVGEKSGFYFVHFLEFFGFVL